MLNLKTERMKRLYFSTILTFFAIGLSAQTIQQLKDSAATFPPMPRETADLVPYVQGLPTFASGAPFNDLAFTIFDTDYMDGENSGGDVFMPVDPSDQFPGTNKVKYIRCILNTDLNQVYGSADADRIILGTHEISVPFFYVVLMESTMIMRLYNTLILKQAIFSLKVLPMTMI